VSVVMRATPISKIARAMFLLLLPRAIQRSGFLTGGLVVVCARVFFLTGAAHRGYDCIFLHEMGHRSQRHNAHVAHNQFKRVIDTVSVLKFNKICLMVRFDRVHCETV
jgi:hypothetical protein